MAPTLAVHINPLLLLPLLTCCPSPPSPQAMSEDDVFLTDLCVRLQPTHFSADTFVYMRGESGADVFILLQVGACVCVWCQWWLWVLCSFAVPWTKPCPCHAPAVPLHAPTNTHRTHQPTHTARTNTHTHPPPTHTHTHTSVHAQGELQVLAADQRTVLYVVPEVTVFGEGSVLRQLAQEQQAAVAADASGEVRGRC